MTKPRFPLVIFDLDGTLVDSFGDICDGIRVACAAIDVSPGDDVVRLATRGVPLEDFYRAAVGFDPEAPGERVRFDRFVDAYRAHYLPGCVQTTRPYPGVETTLRALRALPGRPVLGIATTKRTETAERVLEGTGLRPLLDVVCGSDGLRHKPDPAVLRKVAALAGIPVERAVMIGDTDRDVLAARAAGCAVAAVTHGGFARAELEPLAPDWLIGRFEEVIDIVTDGAAGPRLVT